VKADIRLCLFVQRIAHLLAHYVNGRTQLSPAPPGGGPASKAHLALGGPTSTQMEV
jgi:hypothetical protein